jgi:pimeloyl-ACP methyl ester carboxylesterase
VQGDVAGNTDDVSAKAGMAPMPLSWTQDRSSTCTRGRGGERATRNVLTLKHRSRVPSGQINPGSSSPTAPTGRRVRRAPSGGPLVPRDHSCNRHLLSGSNPLCRRRGRHLEPADVPREYRALPPRPAPRGVRRRARPEDARVPRPNRPLTNAHKIKAPLFIIHGANDPRVPLSEAEQIRATLKKQGTPVWSLVARDEGHGFAKKRNADFQFYAR